MSVRKYYSPPPPSTETKSWFLLKAASRCSFLHRSETTTGQQPASTTTTFSFPFPFLRIPHKAQFVVVVVGTDTEKRKRGKETGAGYRKSKCAGKPRLFLSTWKHRQGEWGREGIRQCSQKREKKNLPGRSFSCGGALIDMIDVLRASKKSCSS